MRTNTRPSPLMGGHVPQSRGRSARPPLHGSRQGRSLRPPPQCPPRPLHCATHGDHRPLGPLRQHQRPPLHPHPLRTTTQPPVCRSRRGRNTTRHQRRPLPHPGPDPGPGAAERERCPPRPQRPRHHRLRPQLGPGWWGCHHPSLGRTPCPNPTPRCRPCPHPGPRQPPHPQAVWHSWR